MDNQDISAHLGKLTAFIGPKGMRDFHVNRSNHNLRLVQMGHTLPLQCSFHDTLLLTY